MRYAQRFGVFKKRVDKRKDGSYNTRYKQSIHYCHFRQAGSGNEFQVKKIKELKSTEEKCEGGMQ